jgi:hypothetical protein
MMDRLGAPRDDPEVMIRPRSGGAADRTRLKFGLALLPLAAIGAVRELRGGASSRLWYLAFVAALIVFVLFARATFLAQTSIRISRTRVRRTGYLGRSASCPRAAIARVVEVNAITSRIGGIPASWLVFLDVDGRTLLRAYAEYYPADERLRLREALAVHWVTLSDVRTFAQLRRELPGSFPWTLAHVWLTFALVALLAVVVLTVGGIIAGSS